MKDIGLKIKEKRKQLGLKQKQVANAIGMDESQYSKIERGILNPTIEAIMELCSILDVTSDWLIGISTQEVEPLYIRGTAQELGSAYQTKQLIPLYNVEAAAGIMPLFNDHPKSVPIDFIKIPNLPKADGAVHVTGDSMYPLLKSGDIVIYKEVKNPENIFWGEMYLIAINVDGDHYTSVKWIQKSELGPNHIKLVSQNTNHQPKDIPISSIVALALVKASVRFNSMS